MVRVRVRKIKEMLGMIKHCHKDVIKYSDCSPKSGHFKNDCSFMAEIFDLVPI